MSDEIKILLRETDRKIDKLMDLSERQNDKLHSHDLKLATYNALLEEHIRRTELLEKSMDDHKAQSQKNHETIQKEIEPILEREKVKNYLKRWLLGAGAMAGSIWGILELIGRL